MARDPYQELGVSRGASADEIRKAFRKLAKATIPTPIRTTRKPKSASSGLRRVRHPGDAEKRKKFDAGEIDADGP